MLAKAVVPGEARGGLIGDLVVGIVGAVVGGWLFTMLIGHSYSGWIGSTLVAFVGAVVLLLLIGALMHRRAVP
jgi:uncharacterized membrane protein YeaQ/YmgE (transglycosylase-associated protein family)